MSPVKEETETEKKKEDLSWVTFSGDDKACCWLMPGCGKEAVITGVFEDKSACSRGHRFLYCTRHRDYIAHHAGRAGLFNCHYCGQSGFRFLRWEPR